MKTSRRGFIGVSFLAAIPSFGLVRSVLSQENTSQLVHKWNPMGRVVESGTAVVSCQKLHDPEICVGTCKLPEYWITTEVSRKTFHSMKRWFKLPLGKIIKNRVLFIDRDGKEMELRESENTRILFQGMGGTIEAECEGLYLEYYRFCEVPAVIFEEKRATAEEIYGVSDFPSISQ